MAWLCWFRLAKIQLQMTTSGTGFWTKRLGIELLMEPRLTAIGRGFQLSLPFLLGLPAMPCWFLFVIFHLQSRAADCFHWRTPPPEFSRQHLRAVLACGVWTSFLEQHEGLFIALQWLSTKCRSHFHTTFTPPVIINLHTMPRHATQILWFKASWGSCSCRLILCCISCIQQTKLLWQGKKLVSWEHENATQGYITGEWIVKWNGIIEHRNHSPSFLPSFLFSFCISSSCQWDGWRLDSTRTLSILPSWHLQHCLVFLGQPWQRF